MDREDFKLLAVPAACLILASVAVFSAAFKSLSIDWPSWIQAFSALSMVVLTGAIIFISTRQAKLMNGQLEAAKDTAEAAKLSADAALGVELPLFVIERRVVALAGIIPAYSRHEVFIRNRGRTSARIVADFLHVYLGQSLPPQKYDIPRRRELNVENYLPPENIYAVVRDERIDVANWQEFIEMRKVLFMIGYIDYLDFTENLRRFGFCYAAVPVRKTHYDKINSDDVEWIRHGGTDFNYHKNLEHLSKPLIQSS